MAVVKLMDNSLNEGREMRVLSEIFFLQNAERAFANTDGTTPIGALANVGESAGTEMLKRLARTAPYYKRNAPHIYSLYVKGECKRGEDHEKPSDPDDPLSTQNINDRYYGSNDPVAEKFINRAKAMPALEPSADTTITTSYVGNLGPAGQITQKDLKSDFSDYFYQFGDIRSLRLLEAKSCAFIQFTTREACEMAAEKSFNKLFLKATCSAPDDLVPSNSKRQRMDPLNIPLPPVPLSFAPPAKLVVPPTRPPAALSSSVPPAKDGTGSNNRANCIYYPSQDPQRLGAKGDVIED
ncbi:unnamed protein product [Angiostrongylus costaricensis]|uniref:Pre-mRNA-splicing factor RBM22 n=1 Tax=Angiostrongylus costaricensis TaxID=334426 RepID=A0A0R3Q0K6_ANGCS|nr:unnamed protein product [Angiostrongylus costaricensis]